jgi:galactokinase
MSNDHYRYESESQEQKSAKAKAFFQERFGVADPASLRVFASPGRVNLIGEHIDYCGGFVFPAAIDLDTTVIARRREDNRLRLAAADLPDLVDLPLDQLEQGRALRWGNYQLGVAAELQNAGYRLSGADLLFYDQVPLGAGLSSSAAIEMATAIALATFSREAAGDRTPVDKIQLAVLSQQAEHHFIGVNCGIMDQFASAMGQKDHAILLDCATLAYQYVPLHLGACSLVLANTCKKRGLGDSKYNERVRETGDGLRILQASLPGKNHLADITPEELRQVESTISDPVIRKRVKHVVLENARVKKAVAALLDNNLTAFADLLNEAQVSVRELYEVTGFELDTMVDEARRAPGCLAARMTGAGFGGCTVNLVSTGQVDSFISRVGAAYSQKTGLRPEFYVCGIGDGAREIVL